MYLGKWDPFGGAYVLPLWDGRPGVLFRACGVTALLIVDNLMINPPNAAIDPSSTGIPRSPTGYEVELCRTTVLLWIVDNPMRAP